MQPQVQDYKSLAYDTSAVGSVIAAMLTPHKVKNTLTSLEQPLLHIGAVIGPDGSIDSVVQGTHEKYDDIARHRVSELPIPRSKKKQIHNGLELTDLVNEKYQAYRVSDKGHAFGNHFNYPIDFDKIEADSNLPKQAAAATIPGSKTLKVNWDYVHRNASKISSQSGLESKSVWEIFMDHEMLHNLQQDGVLSRGRLHVELDVESKLTHFYASEMRKAMETGNEQLATEYQLKANYVNRRRTKMAKAYQTALKKEGYKLSKEQLESVMPGGSLDNYDSIMAGAFEQLNMDTTADNYGIGATEAILAWYGAKAAASVALKQKERDN